MVEKHTAARDSLRGLALGDGFGERWFHHRRGGATEALVMIRERRVAEDGEPWVWTDDTALALAVTYVLHVGGEIDQQLLAQILADAYQADPYRCYGHGMHVLLPQLGRDPGNWQRYARTLFKGEGSLGNGAAMRVAPLGAWFHDDTERAAAQGRLSAEVTHAHPEGIDGGVAVVVAASLFAASRRTRAPEPDALLRQVAELTAPGVVRDGIGAAAELAGDTPAWQAADILGNGQRIRASDTVPFALWSAAHHADDLIGALWTTAEGLGDVDTTCAVTAGVVAARTGLDAVPACWLERAEALPSWVDEL